MRGETLLVGGNGLAGLRPTTTTTPGLKGQGDNALQGDYCEYCTLIVHLSLVEAACSQLNRLQSGLPVG